ncbi:hypothetical protein KY290_005882 [Solanum tuberosum]|uniref:RING-type E3 ubiquitin transferase n=1 Tax=Solanum tuberosum TaxID=4113 RepID=A0ABQ7WFF1_SOLTU|nr:hypothetical protein KY284_005894 [Solanum tuberosum]KAH0723158.1 hypothetical protein KY289_006202 [Solanum tuberosum]KAH0752595.1 hypothetical protein KY285_005743 [Solanum tuberosum]KAH0779455.1 hypothetical protein KY290_005882 [Solanum tuberosum]
MSAHRQTHRSFGNHTHIHSSLNYRNHQQRHQRSYNQQCHQQRGYNQRNAPRRPDYQPSRRHDHNNPHANYWSSAESEYSPVSPSISPYSRFPYYEQIDDVFVSTLPIEFNRISGETFHYINYWTRRLIDLERNLRIEFRDLYDRDPEDDDGDVLKYLKIRTHHVVDKDDIDTEVVEVAEVESDICSICLSVYEHEENIGALQCGHEYHTDCIKQWLLRKNDCPMCRASILPSQEQRCACLM